ncbi:MAG: DUF6279 family lipoprotein [Wenzhouxiangella sp.]
MNRFARLTVVVVLALALSACGVRSAYNNLDWLTMRWLNDQVSLTSEQQLAARQAIADQLSWHCASELPQYAEFLLRIETDVATDRITVSRLTEHGEQLATFARRFAAEARPAITNLLASLDDDQIAELQTGFREGNEEYREQTVEISTEQRQDDQVKGMVRGMRRFAGRPTAQQRERLDQWTTELQPTAELNLAQRERWQARFAEALRIRHDRPEFDRRIDTLFTPASGWSDEYRAIMEYNRNRTLEALVDLHNMAPERQINRFRSRLDRLASDFERLSCG